MRKMVVRRKLLCRLASGPKITRMEYALIVGGCTFTGWKAIVAATRTQPGAAWIEKRKSGKRLGKPGFFRALARVRAA